MTKRRILIVGLVSMAVLAGTAVAAAYVYRNPTSASACAKIKEGMIEAEVRQVLGRDCDVKIEETWPIEQMLDGQLVTISEPVTTKIWVDSSGEINVGLLQKTGRVCGVYFEEYDSTMLRKIRRMLWLEDAGPTLPTAQ